MKHAYLAIKFHPNHKNKKLIEELSKNIELTGYKTTVMVRDFEEWGKISFTAKQLMSLTFKEISKSDILIIEFSEKGVGLGIEAGYAFAKKIPIIVIAKEGSDISNTLKGIASKIIFYITPKDITKSLGE